MMLAGITPPQDIADLTEILDLRGTKDQPVRVPNWPDLARFSNLDELKLLHSDMEWGRHSRHLPNPDRLKSLQLPDQKEKIPSLSNLTGLSSLAV